jgi:error-prone DNA polymerase
MGFYPPDSLVHEAQGRGVEVLPVDVNRSQAECTVTGEGAVRVGLAYIKGIRQADVDCLLASRIAGGEYRSLEDLAARSGLPGSALELLAWSGACEDLVVASESAARRTALWQLGVRRPPPRTKAGEQLALELSAGQAPRLPALGDWERMIADYSSTGVSIDQHALALLRTVLAGQGAVSTAELPGIAHGTEVTVGGLVIARQRPSTANGITFLLIEDEHGTLNVIVPTGLYERRRQVIRTEPLVLVKGRLERYESGGGAINLLAAQMDPLRNASGPAASVTPLRPPSSGPGEDDVPATDIDEGLAVGAGYAQATGTDDFLAVAPPALSFGQGRRR